jgi:phosphoribosyl-ATP pyrophosphohydrolase
VKTLDMLNAQILERARTRPDGSSTVTALDAGVHAIGKKIVEEAAELWMAAEYEDEERTAEEASQLLYHVLVLLAARGVDLDRVYAHL